MPGTPYTLANYAPNEDDSERVLCLKIARMFYDSATGDGKGDPPALDDSAQDALYKVARLLYLASQGDITISF